MILGITYSDYNMTTSAGKCRDSMLKNGVGIAHAITPDFIDSHFFAVNKSILSSERGCGFWLWKPYFIEDIMRSLNDGGILIYSDAGVEFVAPVSNIIDRMDQDIFFFTNGHRQVEWCKTDVIEAINSEAYHETEGFEWDRYVEKKQVQASVIFFKVNQSTRNFVKEWLLYCQMPGFIDDSPSKLPNYPTFAEHRHDQAILTCLQIKYGYKLHWWPTQYSEHIRIECDTYPVMFNHHRKRNREW